MLNTILNEKKELQKFLFDKGFLITTYKKEFNIQDYPFYNNWKVIDVGNYKFYIHYRNKFY
ncbi:MAG: hypothetical protein KBS91_00765, partial [Firmicutes bacterium]|nr:hypothetical protein [Candidatus Caballimonas caccae]